MRSGSRRRLSCRPPRPMRSSPRCPPSSTTRPPMWRWPAPRRGGRPRAPRGPRGGGGGGPGARGGAPPGRRGEPGRGGVMVSVSPVTKTGRQAQIAGILAHTAVRSQDELAELLAQRGVRVTQATLSRDLEELGAVRLRGTDGALVYALPDEAGGPGSRPGRISEGQVRAELPTRAGRGGSARPAPGAG